MTAYLKMDKLGKKACIAGTSGAGQIEATEPGKVVDL